MAHRFSFLLAVCLVCSGFVYPSGGKEPEDFSGEPVVELTDSRGDLVRLEGYPERVVSLGPNITETIYALGSGDLLVGRTDYCDYPAAVEEVPSVGSLEEANLERIIVLEPDLVLASTHVNDDSIRILGKAGIPVALLYGPEDFSGVKEVIEGCGILLNAEQEAAVLMNTIDSRTKALLAEVGKRKGKPTVYYALGFGDGGDWTAGAGTFIDSMIRMAGGDNIARQEGWSYSKEMLVGEDPEVIVLGKGNKDAFLSLPIYKGLRASVSGKVYEIDEDLLVRQGPRLIDGLEFLAAIFGESLEE